MDFNLDEYIMHHVLNSKEWRLPFLPPIHLPEHLSLHAAMVLLCALFLVVVFCLLYKKDGAAPHGITNVLEVFVLYIRDEISIAFLGQEDGRRLTPLFCTFFFFILGMNLMGLVPIFSAATANINVTGALAAVSLGFMTLGSIYKNGLKGFIKALIKYGLDVAETQCARSPNASRRLRAIRTRPDAEPHRPDAATDHWHLRTRSAPIVAATSRPPNCLQ